MQLNFSVLFVISQAAGVLASAISNQAMQSRANTLASLSAPAGVDAARACWSATPMGCSKEGWCWKVCKDGGEWCWTSAGKLNDGKYKKCTQWGDCLNGEGKELPCGGTCSC